VVPSLQRTNAPDAPNTSVLSRPTHLNWLAHPRLVINRILSLFLSLLLSLLLTLFLALSSPIHPALTQILPAATPTGAPLTGTPPTDASPTDASPTDASPTDASPTGDISVDQLQQQQTQIEQYQQGINEQKKRIDQSEQDAKGNLTDLQANLKETHEILQDNQERLILATAYLNRLEAEIHHSESAYYSRQQATRDRLQFLQRQTRLQGWAVLLKSTDLNQLLERRYRVKRLYAADRQRLTELGGDARILRNQRQQIAQQRNGIALLQQKLLLQKATLENRTTSQQTLIQQLQQNRDALDAAQTQLQRDSVSLKDLIQERLRRAPVGLQSNGPLRYPVNAEITSTYGWRVHPILKTERLHNGIDFGTDYGTPIGAAGSGTVIYADWYGGYGYTVIIDHGNGLSSLYAHNSDLLVTEGQTVQAGQPISNAGSTGFSTGPHLHFEVREQGEPVDPMKYL
jgi:murein DD-endopeptidase MepM/ murein hydrolase activator NlpD